MNAHPSGTAKPIHHAESYESAPVTATCRFGDQNPRVFPGQVNSLPLEFMACARVAQAE